MRSAIASTGAAVCAALLLGSGHVAAQGIPGPMTYNQARAYYHFLNSPYSYRAYYGTSPGYATAGFTPYGYEQTAVGPVWWDQRITPRGFSSYHTPAVTAHTIIPYPPAPAPAPVAARPGTRTLHGGASLPERIDHAPAPVEPPPDSPGRRPPVP
jgi:hypothetical protein